MTPARSVPPRLRGAFSAREGQPRPSLALRVGGRRRGLTLLEVLISLAIFLFALAAIAQLVMLGNQHARDVQDQAEAAQLCQSKLAELSAGAEQLGSQSGTFPGAPQWSYSLQCDQGNVAGLWTVQVQVHRQRPDGSRVEVTMSRMVLDPSVRGSTLDSAATSGGGSSPSSGMGSGSTGGQSQ